MSRFWDRDVVRRAYQIGAEKARQGRYIGDWIGDHHQAYRERVLTPLERQIEREWSDYREQPCRQQHGACNDVDRSCLRCAAPWGKPCPEAKQRSSETRFVPCEACGSEGRIYTSNGGPDETDRGPCPVCNGTGAEEVAVAPVTLDDLEIA